MTTTTAPTRPRAAVWPGDAGLDRLADATLGWVAAVGDADWLVEALAGHDPERWLHIYLFDRRQVTARTGAAAGTDVHAAVIQLFEAFASRRHEPAVKMSTQVAALAADRSTSAALIADAGVQLTLTAALELLDAAAALDAKADSRR